MVGAILAEVQQKLDLVLSRRRDNSNNEGYVTDDKRKYQFATTGMGF